MDPTDRRYTSEHEWVKLEGDVAVVGITDFAQDQLGDVVYVELPNVGDKVEAMKPFGVVESVKTASDLFAPLSGTVAEVGSSVTRHRVGDRVGVGCMVNSCGECDNCRAGDEQYCRQGMVGTYAATDRDAALAMSAGFFARHHRLPGLEGIQTPTLSR